MTEVDCDDACLLAQSHVSEVLPPVAGAIRTALNDIDLLQNYCVNKQASSFLLLFHLSGGLHPFDQIEEYLLVRK